MTNESNVVPYAPGECYGAGALRATPNHPKLETISFPIKVANAVGRELGGAFAWIALAVNARNFSAHGGLGAEVLALGS